MTDPAGPQPRLTVLTASWNRAHLLARLHASIAAQPVAPGLVEWLVVDDGSHDNTQAELARLNAIPGPIRLRHLRQPHGGKHRALNAGFGQAKGDWIAVIDSDDWCKTNALPGILELLDEVQDKDIFAVVLPLLVPRAARQFRFQAPDRAVTWPERANSEKPFDSTLIFRARSAGLRFPEIKGEDFLAEAALLFDIGRARRVWLSNHVLVEAEYQPDGLSANILNKRMACPVGACLGYKAMLACPLRLPLRLRALANYGRFWWHARLGGKTPPHPAGPAQWAALVPGFGFSLLDKVRAGRR